MAVRWIEASALTHPTYPDADSAALSASWILYKLSGEKYPGISTSTDWYVANIEASHVSPYSAAAGHVNMYEAHDHTSPRLRLRSRPVQRIDSVAVGQSPLGPDDIFLVNKAFVSRRGGKVWNFQEGVTVTYVHGVEPPEPGVRAAQRLADEIVLSVKDPDACSLPDRVTSVSRQGVSYTVLDAQDFLQDGRTGIYEIDLFLKTANPIGARKRPKVLSPDIPSGHRRS